jgi:general stress protein 26
MKRSVVDQESVKRLGRLIEDFRVAMLTTKDETGALHSRPMLTLYAEFDGDLWFFTHAHTHHADAVQHHHQVNVIYVNTDRERYVSVSGKAELVSARQRMAELWNPIYKSWFPQGLADSDLALLKVHVEQAEYWDSQASVMVQLTRFAKSLVTGEPFDSRVNEVINFVPVHGTK